MSRSVTLHGRNWTQPTASTAWQRERAEPPLTSIEHEFTGRYKLLSWTACIVFGCLLWTAFFCLVLG